MLLFAFPAYARMGKELAQSLGTRLGQWTVDRFPNQELHMTIQTNVEREECLVLGAITPPDEQLLTLLLLSHTLKKEGARSVTALLPYLAYARDEKPKVGQSMATAWVSTVMQSSGVDAVMTVDVHSTKAQRLFPMPVASLSPAELFAQEITRISLQQATIVAPDEGARQRCLAVASAARMPEDIVVLEKKRTREGVMHTSIAGRIKSQAIIVDDILDTGSTLVSCCEQLQQRSVQDITILVTHGLFTGTRWQRLWSLGVKRITCTDTVPQAKEHAAENIRIITILPLLSQYLRAR